MAHDPADLDPAITAFLTERHLATLTTMRADDTPHVVAVGFTWDADASLVRVITWAGSRKARNVAARPGSPAAVCQVDGGRWLTLEGRATVTSDPERVAEAVRRYGERYREPKERDDRVVIEISVDRVLGRG
jgi:PPOX class probable F420-dependent enzyme